MSKSFFIRAGLAIAIILILGLVIPTGLSWGANPYQTVPTAPSSGGDTQPTSSSKATSAPKPTKQPKVPTATPIVILNPSSDTATSTTGVGPLATELLPAAVTATQSAVTDSTSYPAPSEASSAAQSNYPSPSEASTAAPSNYPVPSEPPASGQTANPLPATPAPTAMPASNPGVLGLGLLIAGGVVILVGAGWLLLGRRGT